MCGFLELFQKLRIVLRHFDDLSFVCLIKMRVADQRSRLISRKELLLMIGTVTEWSP